MEKVSTLRELNLRGSTYVFILSLESGQTDELQRTLNSAFEKFGDEGGLTVRAVRATPKARGGTQRELEGKHWSPHILKRFKSERKPVLTIIKTNFSEFDPNNDDWRIIWFGDARQPRNSIPELFSALQRDFDLGRDPLKFYLNPEKDKAPFGRISGPKSIDAAVRQKKGGRPGILDQDNGLLETLDSLLKRGFVSDLEHGWKMRLATEVCEANPGLKETFKLKSVYKAMVKAGVFAEAERSIKLAQKYTTKKR